MNLKKQLGNIIKKSADTVASTNTASWVTYGVEKMPESLKKTR